MAHVYRIYFDEFAQDPPLRNSLDACHPHRAPSVNCPSCGIWGAGALVYPSVDVSTFDDDIRRHIRRVENVGRYQGMTVEEFAAFAARLETTVGPNRPIEPGTCFGPLRGEGTGRFYDFVWNINTVLVRENVFQELCDAGFELLGVAADIDTSGSSHEKLIELEATPLARYPPYLPIKRCGICGRIYGKIIAPGDLVIDAGSFDESIPLQRVREWPRYFIVTRALANAIQDFGFSGVSIGPVDLVDEV